MNALMQVNQSIPKAQLYKTTRIIFKNDSLNLTKYVLFFILTIALLSSCNSEQPSPDVPPTPSNTPIAPEEVEPVEENYSYETIDGENGWGYNILKDGKAFIRQPNIPSLPGNKGFDSEPKAIKVAEYVLNKLKNGIMPPSTNKKELDSLGVL